MTFPTTQWTLLAEATLNGDGEGCRALAKMCESYRQPVAAFIAARGYLDPEREDLVQEFFLRWLKSQSWKRADRSRGRFRSYLLGCVCHMLAHHQQRSQTWKRGCGQVPESLDAALELGLEPMAEPPEDCPEFDRVWAVTLVMNTLQTLAQEYADRGSAGDFAILRKFLPSGGEMITLEAAATELGSHVGAVKSAIFRLREKFRETLRASVACTVSAPHEVEEELQYLRSVLLRTQEKSIPAVEKRKIPE
jgi:RNA polymerase sigma-70 factor (ECF subfamily)